MLRDVVIVGGGPVGLFLAAELRLAGLEPLVLERETARDPRRDDDVYDLTTRTLQTLDLRGLADRATASGEAARRRLAEQADGLGPRPPGVEEQPVGTFLGEFAMIPLVSRSPKLDDLAPPTTVIQGEFERFLAEHATQLGAETWRGAEVVDLLAEDDAVTVELADGRKVAARYVVGCDGSVSFVRERADFDVVGTDPSMVATIAVVHADVPDTLPYGITRAPAGMLVLAPAPAQSMTVEFTTDSADFQAGVERISGEPVRIRAITDAATFTDQTLQPTTYRRGRVLLAGDAAHVHSPIGGHGLNLGLQDAANLGWKLGLVAAGNAPEELLDTYTTERHPLGAQALRDSRAETALLRTDHQSEALREVFTELVGSPTAVRRLVERANGMDVRYDTGPDAHVLAGSFLPGLNLSSGKGMLLDYAGVSDAARPWADPVRVVTGQRPKTMTLLVRPDGYVAWAADQADPEGLVGALTRWFGPG